MMSYNYQQCINFKNVIESRIQETENLLKEAWHFEVRQKLESTKIHNENILKELQIYMLKKFPVEQQLMQ